MIAALILAQTLSDTITVTATRTETRVADTPASVVVLSQETLQQTAAPTLDDALRQVAGFTLFRRAGSRVANPTAQGVTLRGVGAAVCCSVSCDSTTTLAGVSATRVSVRVAVTVIVSLNVCARISAAII